MITTKKHIAILSLLVCLLASVALAFSFGSVTKAKADGETTPVELKANEFAVSAVTSDSTNNRTVLYLNYFGAETNIDKILSTTETNGWPLFVVTKTDGTTENQWYGGWVEGSPATQSVFALPLDLSTWETATLKEGLYSGGAVKLVGDIVLRKLSDGFFVAGSYKNIDFTVSTYASSNTSDDIYITTSNYKIISNNSWQAFKNQAVSFSAKKSDGTTVSLTSTYFQADPTTIYIKFASGALADCVELTLPEGAYQLSDGTYRYIEGGFTFYKHSDGKWYNEKENFTLTFLGEPTNLVTTEGWSGDVSPTLSDDGVLGFTFSEVNKSVYYSFNTVKDVTYSIKFEAQAVGSQGGMSIHLFTADWNLIKDWAWVTESWATYNYEWTATNNSTLFAYQYVGSDSAIQFKNFTISEVVNTKTFTAAGAIGELPTIPEKTGYVGHWEIDGEPITTETTFDATANKTATAVYDKVYTLSFGLESYTEFKNKSTVTASFEGLVATLGTAWDWVEINGTPLTKGKQYTLRMVAKKTAGEGQLVVVDNKWGNTDGVWHTLTGEYTTIDITFTAAKDDATGFYLENSAANTTFDFKSILLTESTTCTDISVVDGDMIGTLPEVPAKDGYIGHWEIDGTEISSATVYDYGSDKNAVAVYEEGYKLTIKDGSSTIYKTVNGTVKLADLGIKDSSTQIVAGYKIDGKLYSADYTFTAAETEIEVVRVAFKVLNGGSIRYIAPVGLRFTANLSETEYNSLKTIVGDSNVSFGIELTRNSNNKLVSVAGNNYYIEDGNIVYSGVIINIPETYYAENFTANAYLSIKYEDKTEAVRIYAVLAGENTRSAYTVAKKAIEAGITGDALTVCQGIVNKVEESSSSSDTSASAQSVVIGAFEIPSNIATTASYAKDAGIDVLFGAYAGNTTEYFATGASTNESTLQAISDAGLKVYISDLEEINGSRKFDSLLDSGRAASFMNSDAVIGYVIDEPTKTEIDNIANNLASVKKNFNNKTLYVNLFPSFWSGITDDFNGNYKSYLTYFCDKVLSKLETGELWLSVDRYPLTYDSNNVKCLDEGWLSDVQDVVEVAKSYNAKVNFFIQTTPYGTATTGGHDRVPTVEDIRLQEMALMAFGVDGISFFAYATTVENTEFSASQVGMIDRNGNRTAIYYDVQTATLELKNFDEIIKAYTYQGVLTTDAGQTINSTDSSVNTTTNNSFSSIDRIKLSDTVGIKSLSSVNDTLYGYSKDENGNIALTVVNYNDTSKGVEDSVEISFDTSKYNAVIYYERGTRKFAKLDVNGKLTLSIDVGEGVFVIPCMSK